jgi:hypothetical protein
VVAGGVSYCGSVGVGVVAGGVSAGGTAGVGVVAGGVSAGGTAGVGVVAGGVSAGGTAGVGVVAGGAVVGVSAAGSQAAISMFSPTAEARKINFFVFITPMNENQSDKQGNDFLRMSKEAVSRIALS